MAIASAHSRRPLHASVARPRTPLAGAASFLARFSFVLLLAALATRWLGIVELDELFAPAVLLAVSLASAIVVGLAALVDAWLRGAAGAWRAIRALMLAAVVAAPLAFGFYRMAATVALPDVSTDPVDPPRISDLVLAPDEAVGAAPGLTTRRYDAAIERVGNAVVAAVDELGWAIDTTAVVPAEVEELGLAPAATSDEAAIPIPRMRPLTPGEEAMREARLAAEREAVAEARREQEAIVLLDGEVVSPVIGIRSDVVIRLRDDGDATAVDVRLRTRGGGHDLGENARRARAFLDALDRATSRAGIR